MLLPRVLTAAVGIPAFLYLIDLGGVPFIALVTALAVLALHEYATILWLGGRGVQRVLTVAGGGLLALATAVSGRPFPGAGLLGLALAAVVGAAVLSELFRTEHSFDRIALSVFGMVFIGWSLGHLPLIRELEPHGEALTFLLFASVWASDSAAYAVGSVAGKHRLAPVISPKKSWEGAAAGLAAAVAAFWLAQAYFLGETLSPLAAVALGAVVGVVGQVSDLSQSLIKRAAGFKDSASLLPGHGGVFDRMDSFLLLAPLFYYCLLIF